MEFYLIALVEQMKLERFDKVNLVGRVELHLERNSHHSMEIMTKAPDGAITLNIIEDSSFEISYRQGAALDIDSYIKEFVRPFDWVFGASR